MTNLLSKLVKKLNRTIPGRTIKISEAQVNAKVYVQDSHLKLPLQRPD